MKQPQPPANSHFQPTFDSTLKDPGWEQILNNNLAGQKMGCGKKHPRKLNMTMEKHPFVSLISY